MLIVIEGLDLCGKTSLATRIAEKVGGQVTHAGPPSKHPLEEYEATLDGYDPRGDKHLILDRWHVGEYVWPHYFGRKTQFDLPTRRHVEMFMRSRGAFIIYAEREFSRLSLDLVEQQEPLKPEDLHEVSAAFKYALTNSGSYGTWDFEHGSDSRVDGFILNARTRSVEVEKVWDAVGPGWVGSHRPRVLLVGDELGPEKEGRTPPDDIPFAPYTATSGHYLLPALPFWRNVALVNSLQGRKQSERDLLSIWRAFGEPSVVALGKRAASELKDQGVHHSEVPHPQFWRRFRYHERNKYALMIKEAAGVDLQD